MAIERKLSVRFRPFCKYYYIVRTIYLSLSDNQLGDVITLTDSSGRGALVLDTNQHIYLWVFFCHVFFLAMQYHLSTGNSSSDYISS